MRIPAREASKLRHASASPIAPLGAWVSIEGRSEKEATVPRREWTAKQDRKYEHIKDSLKGRGTPTKKAKEIAARTVNKERAQRGQSKTASRSSVRDLSSSRRGGLRSGTSRPKGRTREQLYNEARQMGIEGRSKMSKEQLQRAVDRTTR
jgi:hypothetical protein